MIDPISHLLATHGAPRLAALADDLAGTYLRIADMLGARRPGGAIARHAGRGPIHRSLAALAAAAGDRISTREHALTGARLTAGDDDAAAMMAVDVELAAAPGPDAIYAIYDLSKGPVTYDFTHFLVLAERYRELSGKAQLYVIFVPGAKTNFRRKTPRDLFLSDTSKLWRLANLLAPCAYLVASCAGLTVCESREDARTLLATLPADQVFPPDYRLDQATCPYFMPLVQEAAARGGDIRAFRAPPLAAELVRRWFAEIAGAKPVVSITLRQSDFQPARNSNPKAWRSFAEFCIAQGFHPVFIPDTEALLAGQKSGFEDFTILDLPALSVGTRMAVYQESFVNAMVNNGPYGLCAYHPDARYLAFKMLNPTVSTCTAAFLAAQGIHPGRQLPFAGPHQRIVWADDEPDIITHAFTQMVESVLAEPRPAPARAIG